MLGLVPSSMSVRGFSAASVGLVGAAYFLGFLLGAWRGWTVISEVGHVRSFGGLIALILVSVLALPLLPNPWAWGILRFVHGFAAGGAFLAIEAWLNGAAGTKVHGRLLAIYMIITLGGLSGAQLLAGVSAATTPIPFLIGGILFAASILPVMLTRIEAPAILNMERMPVRQVYRHSPFAFATSFAAGMSVGAFWTFTPYVARDMGLSLERSSMLVAATVFAGLLWQWPAGSASDRFDRRHVVVVVTAAGAAAALALLLTMDVSRLAVLYVGFAVLAGFFCLYPLTVAHALDHAPDSSTTLALSQGLLMSNGLGQTIGPLVAGVLVSTVGPRGLPLYFLLLLGGITAFAVWRLRTGFPVAPEAQGKHVFVRTTTPAGAGLDPRLTE
jgi:MFS family permease